ncbi:MAG TPA: hypothetical protein VD867_06710 [Burkholderiales bacterium]|nr:hypothetical protein [Burkholderiales bacterium]
MSQPAAIKKLYDEGMREVFRVVGSFESTPEQLTIANQTAVDLTSMLVKHTLETIDGRTALLAGLIVELNQVIAAVETTPPYAGALESFTRLAAQAGKLFAEDVKSLT